MSTVKNYLSLIRFSHTIFAMPFALIGFFLGVEQAYLSRMPGWHVIISPLRGWPSIFRPHAEPDYWKWVPQSIGEVSIRLGLVILCMIFARSAAMAFNRWLDVKWDALNPRTAIREIP